MVLAETLPYDENLVVAAGATFRFAIQWLPGGVPIPDWTGWDAWMPLGRDIDDPLLELTVERGEITFEEDGWVWITMSPDQTLELSLLDIPTKKGTGTLEYNLMMEDSSGVIYPFLRGKMFIEHYVQRPK